MSCALAVLFASRTSLVDPHNAMVLYIYTIRSIKVKPVEMENDLQNYSDILKVQYE